MHAFCLYSKTAETLKGLCLQRIRTIAKQFFSGEQVLNKIKPTEHCEHLFQNSYDTAGCEGDVNESISWPLCSFDLFGIIQQLEGNEFIYKFNLYYKMTEPLVDYSCPF